MNAPAIAGIAIFPTVVDLHSRSYGCVLCAAGRVCAANAVARHALGLVARWARAREEIKRHAGTQFDPAVVEAFLRAEA
jgi:hypothetical protein